MREKKDFTILIVDDQRSNIVVLSNILRPSYTVIAAKDGPAAIEIAKTMKPDLILLDIVMPGMSGFEVLTELKNSDDTMHIPVIFVTGMDSDESEAKGLRLGAVDYITKPFHNTIVQLRVKTQLKILEQIHTIEHLGMIDALTNIPNRRSFDNQLKIEWNRETRNQTSLGIMMLDIDNFKQINDTYGHPHGDEVLKAVADVISQSMRRSCDFTARWGGEEFAVLVPDTDLADVMALAEQIRVGVQNVTIPYDDQTDTNVTISIGVFVTTPTVDMAIEDFCAYADKALYLAKNSGKNVVKCYES